MEKLFSIVVSFAWETIRVSLSSCVHALYVYQSCTFLLKFAAVSMYCPSLTSSYMYTYSIYIYLKVYLFLYHRYLATCIPIIHTYNIPYFYTIGIYLQVYVILDNINSHFKSTNLSVTLLNTFSLFILCLSNALFRYFLYQSVSNLLFIPNWIHLAQTYNSFVNPLPRYK